MERKKRELAAAALIAAQITDGAVKYTYYYGGHRMGILLTADAGFSTIMESVVNVGITPVLLVVFIIFFLRRAKDDDSRVKAAYEDAQKKIEENNRLVQEREDTLMAESAKREEILRQEAEKRESLIRKEAEKRESILMTNQDRMLDSMDKITESLSKIENSLNKMESRHEADIGQLKNQMQNLEDKIDHMGGN
jgi:uncharacterized protein YydD (DUF2326 family)